MILASINRCNKKDMKQLTTSIMLPHLVPQLHPVLDLLLCQGFPVDGRGGARLAEQLLQTLGGRLGTGPLSTQLPHPHLNIT